MKGKWAVLTVLMGLCAPALLWVQNTPQSTASLEKKARQAAHAGKIAYKLTTPEELNAVLGRPKSQRKEQGGGMEMLTLWYSGLTARFTGMRERGGPFTLQALNGKGSWLDNIIGRGGAIDIGQDRPVVLRSADDLAKFDSFWGFAGVSLAGLDLREHKATLEKMPFDSQTHWPPRDRLPEGFD